jgi:hypothetical protein
MAQDGDVPGVEIVPAGEQAQIDEIATATPVLQEKRAPIQEGKILRGVHPKSHGCVKAKFVINPDLDERYRVGLFSNPGEEFEAWNRLSGCR